MKVGRKLFHDRRYGIYIINWCSISGQLWPSADSRTGWFLCVKSEFIIPIYKKSAGICTCYSSHTSKALHCPLLSERATQKPTPICITTLEYTFDQQKRTKDINIPRRHPLLLCLWQQFQKVQIFEASRTKRQVNVFSIYVYFPPP